MADDSGLATELRPATVAIHDDADVRRKIAGFDEDHGGGIGVAGYHLGPLAAMTRNVARFFAHSRASFDRSTARW